MKIHLILLFVFAPIGSPLFSQSSVVPLDWFTKAKITLRVLDETGKPLVGVHASVGFEISRRNLFRGGDIVAKKGLTNADGLFTAENLSPVQIGIGAEAQGYYSTGYNYLFQFQPKDNQWQPWNPTVNLVLKKIINPIPLYARQVTFEFPAEAVPLGYDLAKADWVPPYGKGNVADLIFKVGRTVRGQDDFSADVQLAFSNPEDGIQPASYQRFYGSELKLRTAPESGYANHWSITWNKKTDQPAVISQKDDRAFFYRVRTVVDKNGKIISALYGKTLGDFMFSGVLAKQTSLTFTYYLNPKPLDRNLEFDPKRNLFEELRTNEEVSVP